MARKILTDGGYYLNPATKTLVIQRAVPQERLVLVSNVSTGQVIFNFSDASLRATSYTTYTEGQLTATITGASTTGAAVTFTAANTFTVGQIINISGVTPSVFNLKGVVVTAANSTTFTVASTVTGTYVSGGLVSVYENSVVVLNFNTGSMLATHKLQVVVDEFNERFTPSEELTDPVGKLRVSTPQALIDTDFEYGTQASKWETQTTTNLRPNVGFQTFNSLPVSDIQTGAAGTKTITVTVATGTASLATTGTQGNGTTAYYTTSAAHNIQPGQVVTVTGMTPSGYNTTSGQPAVVLAVPSTTTFVLANNTTGQSTVGGTVTINVAPAIGSPIYVQDTFSPTAVGNYVVETRASETTFTYTAKGSTPVAWASQTVFDSSKTVVSNGPAFTNAGMTISGTPTVSSGIVTITTSVPHGLSIGNEISCVGATAGASPHNGNLIVTGVTSATVFTVVPATAPTTPGAGTVLTTTGTASVTSNIMTVASAANVIPGMIVTGTGIPTGTSVLSVTQLTVLLSQAVTAALSSTSVSFFATIYARSQGQVTHRAFDGGVIFSAYGAGNNTSLVRQTRRYFRYQSGKGIQVSSGTIIRPSLGIDSLTYSAPVVTVVTKERHGLQPGYQVAIYGANENGYNGTFAVVAVTGLNSFTYAPTPAPTVATATGTYYASISGWNGASNRLGVFDQQNGLFFEHDGTQLYAVMRSSIFQIPGRVTVTNGSSTVTGSTQYPAVFNKHLIPGDFIVIRGQSYKVENIASDTSMTIQPAYRGGTTGTAYNQVIVSKTIDTRIPQSSWNIDKMDGTGPSGLTLDTTKMQMFYIDYSWYGAGSVRWGFRGPKGNIVYCHKLQNNNFNAQAYMRSGNLPARYETVNQPATTLLTTTLGTSDSTITVNDTTGFYRPVTVTTTASGSTSVPTIIVNSAANITIGMFANASNITAGTVVTAISGTTLTLSANNTGAVSGAITFSSYPGSLTIRSGANVEIVNYTGITSNTFTGVTRGNATGNTSLALTCAVGSNIATVASASNLMIGQRIVSPVFPENTKIEYIQGLTLVLSGAPTTVNPTVIVPPMSLAGTAFTASTTAPIVVEQAFPTFTPTISHWGTSVMMDGRYDDDKSLNFTFGQTTTTSLAPFAGTTATGTTAGSSVNVTLATANANIVPGMFVTDAGTAVPRGTYVVSVTSTTAIVLNNAVSLSTTALTFSGAATKALMSIRVSPSVDNGIPAAFGLRELTNRMQLQLRALDLTVVGSTTGNILIQILLNGQPYNPTALTNVAWTNAVRGATFTPNSSLAQIADYSTVGSTGSQTYLNGGEVTGGFFTNSTTQIDLNSVRDLGNAILGGGSLSSRDGIYPDGPDTLTIVATNVSTVAQQVIGRLTWTEAQA